MNLPDPHDFYVRCPSNVLDHPHNTPSTFTVTLPSVLSFDDLREWRVGMSMAIVPHRVGHTRKHKEYTMTLKKWKKTAISGGSSEQDDVMFTDFFEPPERNYQDVAGFVAGFMRELQHAFNRSDQKSDAWGLTLLRGRVRFEYNWDLDTLRPSDVTRYRLLVSESLTQLFGWDSVLKKSDKANDAPDEKDQYVVMDVGVASVDWVVGRKRTGRQYVEGNILHLNSTASVIKGRMRTLFVYSPIVENTVVGDVNAPLLNMIPWRTTSQFGTIDFILRTETGEDRKDKR